MDDDSRATLIFMVCERGFDLAGKLVKSGVYVWLIWCGLKAIEALAGEDTSAEFVFQVIRDGRLNTILILLVIILTICYALLQERIKRRKTGYLSDRYRSLEQQIDPDRTTSGLTQEGDSNPRD